MTHAQAHEINRAAWDLSQLCRDAHADYALTELTKLAARLSDAAVDAMPAQQEAATGGRSMTARIKTAYEAIAAQWCAWDDRLGADTSPYGWGATEAEAIADLVAQQEAAA